MDGVILGLETSCDETAAAVVTPELEVLSNVISSQVEVHAKYGGVVPELASRKHLENIMVVVQRALEEAGVSLEDVGCVAVTYGPGLVGALLVGVSAAKGLAYGLGVPLVGVNHLQGHIYSGFLADRPPDRWPLVCLVVSGGHTDLVLMEGHGRFRLLGSTRDDAAGEAFDKAARTLGLGYPGGPAIDALARRGDPGAVSFPRAYLEPGSLDFSFSGLKTAVLLYVREHPETPPEDVAAAFERAVVDVLVDKTFAAARRYGAGGVVLAGGVAANTGLREAFIARSEAEGLPLVIPALEYCTDNAAMIAACGWHRFRRGARDGLDLDAVPGLELEEGC